MITKTSAPTTDAPPDSARRRSRLGTARRLLESAIGKGAVRELHETGTKVDVGYWLRKRRVWLCLTDSEVVLFAWGKQPYLDRIPLSQLGESQYNHITGELVLAPAGGVSVPTLRMAPLAALDVLAQLG